MVRRDEAATASAFFSNEDVVSITAADDDNPMQQASAEVLKALLQYRLADGDEENTIPWFQTLVGARQDAEVMGICVGKAVWEYEERFLRTEMRPRTGPDGAVVWNADLQAVDTESVDLYEKTKDRPVVTLLAPENIRFEPGCDWRNPVRSSPYLIEMIPVYIQDARAKMEATHGAPAEWQRVSESALRGSTDLSDDVTRRTRETGRVPGKDHDAWKPKDFDIAWTRLITLRWGGQDWVYQTLAGGGEILALPKPIKEVWLHGERPYVVGCVVLETHKTYPSSKVELTAQLQQAANQDWNSRFDAVMLNLQPRQYVREGSGQDINDLRTFMPGKVVMVNAKNGALGDSITWDRPPPVDSASFQEQDRINIDWDDLTGAPNAVTQASQVQQQSATGMSLMSGEASGLSEYELRLFAETFVTPTMRLLIKLEQAYETDAHILALAGKRAQLMQRFGVDRITDDLLNQSVTTKVNVGIGATNPAMKLRNFATAGQILGHIFGPVAAQGANFDEVSKEVFGLSGYKDGARFIKPGFDPRVAMLQQELQKQQGKDGGQGDQGRLQSAQVQAQSRIEEKKIQQETDIHTAQIDAESKRMSEDAENWRAMLGMQRELLTMGGQAPGGSMQTPGQPMLAGPSPQQSMPQPAGPDPMLLEAAQHARETHEMVSAMHTGVQGMGGTVQAHGDAMHQMAMLIQEGNQQLVQALGQGMQILAQGIQQSNDQLEQTLQTIAAGLEQSAQRTEDGFVKLNTGLEQGQAAVMAALSRKKRVVRDAEGRVSGVESV